jgi:hypothetical protein
MTEEKKAKLSRSQQMQNIFFGMGTGYYMVMTVIWYVGLCWHTRRKHNRFAGAPVTIMLFGSDPEQALDILKEHNLRYAYGSIQWAVLENQVALLLYFMVSKASFDYADNILYQHSGDTFVVLTNPGSKRGQGIRKPYAQRQPSQPKRQAQASKAKLGKTYR